jgi:hypothetical protein
MAACGPDDRLGSEVENRLDSVFGEHACNKSLGANVTDYDINVLFEPHRDERRVRGLVAADDTDVCSLINQIAHEPRPNQPVRACDKHSVRSHFQIFREAGPVAESVVSAGTSSYMFTRGQNPPAEDAQAPLLRGFGSGSRSAPSPT